MSYCVNCGVELAPDAVRCPLCGTPIRRGAFWYYLEPNTAPGPYLKEDVSDPCQPVRFKEDNGWLLSLIHI